MAFSFFFGRELPTKERPTQQTKNWCKMQGWKVSSGQGVKHMFIIQVMTQSVFVKDPLWIHLCADSVLEKLFGKQFA